MVHWVHRHLHRSSRGQGLIEFALIVPILILILLLGLDLGRVFFGWVGLTNATRIGASYAAAHPTAWGNPGSYQDQVSYENQILADASALNCDLPGTIPDPAFTGENLGDSATVSLSCQFTLITPVVSQILGGTITIGAESVFPVRAGETAFGPMGSIPPSPSPTASPNPSATAAPTPRMCFVPSFIGERANNAASIWSRAGFTTAVDVIRPPNGNYTITAQRPAVGGQPVGCDTTVMHVSGQ